MPSEHFAKFLSNRHAPYSTDFYHLARQLSEAVEAGSSCLHLAQRKKHTLEEWLEILQPDAEGSTVCSPGGHAPLVFTHNGHLYLQRYYLHELGIFEKVSQWLEQPIDKISAATKKKFNALFAQKDQQSQAAETALQRRFTIISGGPGTGKTTTVLKILMLLREQGYYRDPNDVLLLAPTGKAADRLRQSIVGGLNDLGELATTDWPQKTSTIHRTLGYRPGSIEFRHNAKNPLAAKVVVIDESSMVDLPLMHRLLDAIPATARIILLGDKNQLASVQVGTVLSDMMEAAANSQHTLKECSVTLHKSYRTQGPVNAVCASIKDGDGEQAWIALTQSSADEIGATIHHPLPRQLRNQLSTFVEQHWLPVLLDTELTPAQKLAGIDRFRILCPTHNGPYGISALNQTVEKILDAHGVKTTQVWYAGRSVIIQQNDHALGIYNGDTGLVLADAEDNSVHVHFSDAEQTRSYAPSRLPEVKTAWALTIHRTQGSEYDHILLVIPPIDDSPILSRELLYTGLSRAKKSATVWCSEDSFKQTISTTVQRASGLAAMFDQ